MVDLSIRLLLLMACTSSVDARVYLRSKSLVGERLLTENTNMDDYSQLELFNEFPLIIATPSVSEETGEQSFAITWDDGSVHKVCSSIFCFLLFLSPTKLGDLWRHSYLYGLVSFIIH
jgi:hypothetical protein